jgi:hypothetical protein
VTILLHPAFLGYPGIIKCILQIEVLLNFVFYGLFFGFLFHLKIAGSANCFAKV